MRNTKATPVPNLRSWNLRSEWSRAAAAAVLCCFAVCALPALAATQESQRIEPTRHPFLWRIEGKGAKATSWLYGTMHLGDRRLVTLPQVVQQARDGADALYCELALDEAMRQQMTQLKRIMAPRGETLDKVLPEDLHARLDARLRKLGASIAPLNKFRVWAVGVTMAQLEAARHGMTESLDKQLYMDAKRDDKEVGGLETLDEQLGAMGGGATADHVESLRLSLDLYDELDGAGQSAMKLMLEAYLSGSEKQILDFIGRTRSKDEDLNDRLMKPMLEDRNVRMADRIDEKIRTAPDKKYFFAIGALHFIGDKGLVTLLREKGYTITRIQPPTPSWEQFIEMRNELAKLRRQVNRLEAKLRQAGR